MESIYAALILHKAQKEISEANLEKVLKAAGLEVDPEQLKKLITGLKSTDLDDIVKNASTMSMTVAAAPARDAKKASKGKKKPKKEEEEEEEEPAGIGSLF